ncbi:hypothetical protein [Roseibium polysiphoniae]|uniref:Uncharacterized protein n=1 Tax=Roseibium polysiphoniae TaxID=2571221 RepID=A0ABR9CE46_9HYPH|nr:hypothetical protein [Roseibium polysiphoniae]MBD8877913.1 hypothetical protein [Roseibium polysiphoniae]
MSKRLFLLLVAASLAGTPAIAKTVRTDTIRITPMEAPASGTIPVEDSLTAQKDPSADDNAPLEEPAPAETYPLPEVLYDPSLLPTPVARMRSQLLDAAISGDIERLRMVLESNEVPPTLSLIEIGDPIEFLKESSGDPDGLEILAILADTLDAGFLHADVGTAQEMYIWPYFARYPFHALTADQKVEMYRIVTAADFAEMEAFGVWLFYRVGIGKDGTLHYFVAGE